MLSGQVYLINMHMPKPERVGFKMFLFVYFNFIIICGRKGGWHDLTWNDPNICVFVVHEASYW